MTYDPDSVKLAGSFPTYDCAADERSLHVLQPVEGGNLSGDVVVVRIAVCGINLVEKWGQANAANEGHLVVQVDGIYAHPPAEGLVTTLFGLPVDEFEPGGHQLRVQVRNNDFTDIAGFSPISVNFNLSANEQ